MQKSIPSNRNVKNEIEIVCHLAFSWQFFGIIHIRIVHAIEK
jgi:hypothetical protein